MLWLHQHNPQSDNSSAPTHHPDIGACRSTFLLNPPKSESTSSPADFANSTLGSSPTAATKRLVFTCVGIHNYYPNSLNAPCKLYHLPVLIFTFWPSFGLITSWWPLTETALTTVLGMTLAPFGNKHRKLNCLLRGRQVSAESSIFGANRCRQSTGQVRNQGGDLLHVQFWVKHEEKETQLKSLKEPHKRQSKEHISYDGNVIFKRTPQDRFSGAKDI